MTGAGTNEPSGSDVDPVGPSGATESGAAKDVVLEATGLVRHYASRSTFLLNRPTGWVRAVDGIDLQLHRGESLGIVGESGSGKSTLARMLSLVEEPTSGSVNLLGTKVDALRGRRKREFRRHVQMVFQDPFTSLNPRQRIGDIIREPLDVHRDGPRGAARRERVSELLDLVGLDPAVVDRYPHQFSGGQRQRIGIARAVALNPEVLVCDEAVSALDVSVQAQVLNLLLRLQAELGLAYIFISHDLGVVQHIAHRVAVMYLGRVVESGTAAEVYEHPRHPYTRALLAAIPQTELESDAPVERIVLSGEQPSAANPPGGCRFRTRCWMAQDVCETTDPELRATTSGAHLSACHFAEEVPTSQPERRRPAGAHAGSDPQRQQRQSQS